MKRTLFYVEHLFFLITVELIFWTNNNYSTQNVIKWRFKWKSQLRNFPSFKIVTQNKRICKKFAEENASYNLCNCFWLFLTRMVQMVELFKIKIENNLGEEKAWENRMVLIYLELQRNNYKN
jgi:hypothetical protein